MLPLVREHRWFFLVLLFAFLVNANKAKYNASTTYADFACVFLWFSPRFIANKKVKATPQGTP